MALNQFMHPRNFYRSPPDFKELTMQYPEFRKYAIQDLSGKIRIDFKDPDALRALTLTLLKRDFDLEIEIPKDRLIPTLPLRLNYILWIEDLLNQFPYHNADSSAEVVGLDIGTGSTCIYPLLGNRKNNWKFVATDTDVEAFEYAQKNVARNGLNDDISVLLVPKNTSLVEAVQTSSKQFDFCMCNPPFFLNETEAESQGKGRRPLNRPPPKAANCHQKHEAVTEGGEVAFVNRMIENSLLLKDAVRLYSTMLGKKHSLGVVQKILQGLNDKGVKSVTTTEFCQGHTMRWGIAWTFIPHVNLHQVLHVKKVKEKPTKPLGFVILKQIQGAELSFAEIIEKIEEILLELKMSYTELKRNKNIVVLRCIAHDNTWSHQRRKRREAMRHQDSNYTIENTNMEHNSPSTSAGNGGVTQSASKAEFSNEMPEDEDPPTKMQKCEPSLLEKDELCTVAICQPTHCENDKTTLCLSSTYKEHNKTPAIESLLTLRNSNISVMFEILWTKGSLGKDAVHQVMQYFKNKLT